MVNMQILSANIGETIDKINKEIQAAQTFWDKVVIFWGAYKIWIIVGLIILVGIIFFVNLIEANIRKKERENRNK